MTEEENLKQIQEFHNKLKQDSDDNLKNGITTLKKFLSFLDYYNFQLWDFSGDLKTDELSEMIKEEGDYYVSFDWEELWVYPYKNSIEYSSFSVNYISNKYNLEHLVMESNNITGYNSLHDMVMNGEIDVMDIWKEKNDILDNEYYKFLCESQTKSSKK